MAKNTLPRGFRIVGDIHSIDPHDVGHWRYSLQVWETRTVGMWLWKHDETRWWNVENSGEEANLVQTAWLMHEEKEK